MIKFVKRAAVASALLTSLLVTACDQPTPAQQVGYRGVGMIQSSSKAADTASKKAIAKIPEVLPPADPGGKKASEVYKNVQVLGNLTENEFLRTMSAITEWVSPEQGCNYCHNANNLAEDSVYTKIVARRMFQMTQKINETWKPHVGATGVTCYTCHAGNPVPKNIWYQNTEEPLKMAGYSAGGQNKPNASVGMSSMIADPFTALLTSPTNGAARVQGLKALPIDNARPGDTSASMQKTEQNYAVMIHMSTGLGVGCTYCHNSRAFSAWDQSTPQRVTAWHGIQMTRDLNSAYLTPLQSVYPEARLGTQGDAPKAYCSTCHQGVNKPLGGAQMWKDYPELKNVTAQAIPLPTTALNTPEGYNPNPYGTKKK
jgi:photosynthetic reaction center cytochrome c subunit